MAIHSFGRLAIMVPSSRGLILYSNRLPRPGVLSEAQMIMSLLAAAAGTLLVLQTPPPPQAPTAHPLVRVFLDCDECDENYLKKEVTFIDYVRNREDADVHVLVTTQTTGGGGRQFTIKFIGLHAYDRQDETLTYNAPQTATSDERRAGFAEVFRVGLVRY